MSPSQDARRSPSSRMRVTAAIIGNALEFYDFTVYGIFATWLAKAFFPADNPNVSLLLAIATFGVGFVARPLGGVVIGAYADRFGRKPAMTLTIWLMAIGSGMIGVLPTYAQVGVLAPVLLVLARLLQGFSTGGWGPDEMLRAPSSDDVYQSLTKTHARGRELCVFEQLVRISPVGETAKSLNICRVCHARMLAEHMNNPPVYWPGCPYVEFKK